jgi:ABC-type Fe3+ transport system permease subunit
MKKIPTFWFALIVGIILEGIIVALALSFASFGKDLGDPNVIGAFTLIVHGPGVLAARFVQPVDSHRFDYAIILSVTTVLWSVMAFIVISILRRFYGRESKTAA